MKAILPDHIPVNTYKLFVVGAPPLTILKMEGFEEELETTDLPDRTVASGGNVKPMEVEVETPTHHRAEQTYWQLWFKSSKLSVPGYKKAGTLVISSVSGITKRTYSLVGVFPKKQKTSDLDQENEGELHRTNWTLSIDTKIEV